jgi:hypothetical protein
MLDNKHMDI